MKLSTILFTVSLAGNAALAAFLVLRPAAPVPALAAATPPVASVTPGEGPSIPVSAAPTAPETPAGGSAGSWEQLRTNDLAALVTRLRAAGFPPAVIRRIIITLVTERFDARRLEVEKGNLEAPYWTNTQNSFTDPKLGPEMRKLQVEQTDELKQLLGGNLNDLFADTEDNKALLRLQVGDIPPEKIDQLYAVGMNYMDKIMQIYGTANNGLILDTDREKLASLEKDMNGELSKFLTPAEVADFMMHSSQTGVQLKSLLAPIKPSEAEYRTIFPLYQAFIEQYPAYASGTQTGDLPPAEKAALDQMNSQVTALLGPARAADFQQANNPAYSQLNRLVARLDLPISTATQVAAVQQDIQDRVAAVRADPTLSGAPRRAQLTALATEASTKIGTALGGAQGLDAYKQYGGQWLVNLNARARPAAPKN